MLEICCGGRRTVERNVELSKVNLVEWVWNLYGEGHAFEAADMRLSRDFDEEQMECLMVAGLWCCHPYPSFRPSIKQVVSVLNFQAPLPNLPSKLPKPMYIAPSMDISSSFYASPSTSSSTNHQNQYSSASYLTDSPKSEGLSIYVTFPAFSLFPSFFHSSVKINKFTNK